MVEKILRDIKVSGSSLELVLEDIGSFHASDYTHAFVTKRLDEETLAQTIQEISHKNVLKSLPHLTFSSLYPAVKIEAPPQFAASRCFHLSRLEEHLLQSPVLAALSNSIKRMFRYLREHPPKERKPYSLAALRNHLYSHPNIEACHYPKIDLILSILEEGWPILGNSSDGPKIRIPSPLPEGFHRGNYTKLSRWKLAPRGSVVDVDPSLLAQLQAGEKNPPLENRIKYLRPRSASEILSENFVLLDIEKPLFGTPEEEVSWTALLQYSSHQIQQRIIYTLYDVPQGNPEHLTNFSTQKCDHEKDLVQKIAKQIRQNNTTIFVAYNVPFDAIQLREAGDFEVGTDLSEPKKVVSTPFFQRIGIKGLDVLDLLQWARIQLDYLPNHKLVTISRHVLGKQKFDKEINYEQQRELEQVCRNHLQPEACSPEVKVLLKDRSAPEIIASYVSKDASILAELLNSPLFQKSLEHACTLAKIFRVDPFLLLHDPSRVQDFLERRFFEEKGLFPDLIYPHYPVFKEYEAKVKAKLQRDQLAQFPSKQQGLIKNIAKVYLPWGRALRSDLCWLFPEMKEFYSYLEKNHHDKKSQFFIAQYERALSEWMYQDYATYLYEKNKLKLAGKGLNQTLLQPLCQSLATSYLQENLEDKLNHSSISQKDLSHLLNPTTQNLINQLELSIPQLQQYFSQWCKVRQKNRILWGAYETGWETYQHRQETFLTEINNFLSQNQLEVIHAQGQYLYLKGNLSALDTPESQLILVDKIPSAYRTQDNLYYTRHGAMFGFKRQGLPTDKLNLWEMETYGDFLENILDQNIPAALENLWCSWDALSSHKVPKGELCWRTQGRNYGLVDGEKVEILPEHKIDWEPDWDQYIEREQKKSHGLLKPLLGREASAFLEAATSPDPQKDWKDYLPDEEQLELRL